MKKQGPEITAATRALAKNIRRLRERREWCVNDLAVLSGLSQPAVRRIECARSNPKPETVAAIAKALDCSVAWLSYED